MRTATRWLAVAVIVGLAVMTGKVRAQEEEQAKTPQQVVSEFSYALAAALKESEIDPASLNKVVTVKSRKALSRWGDQVIEPLAYYLIIPHLVPHESVVDGDTATVATLLQPRSLEVKLVKDEGQWRVDLLATLASLPEPFRVDAADLAAMREAAQVEPVVEETVLPTVVSSPVVEVSLANFKPEVLESEISVLVEFWVQDSDDCAALKPIFEELATEYAGEVKFAAVNAAKDIPLSLAYGINRIPCLVLFRGEEELARRYPTAPVS